ncbi:MAG: hypothetical protein MUC63_00660, partial [Planctomycetes bacterium]|nr:hypothetical protein [Planctomycetota bacterium]
MSGWKRAFLCAAAVSAIAVAGCPGKKTTTYVYQTTAAGHFPGTPASASNLAEDAKALSPGGQDVTAVRVFWDGHDSYRAVVLFETRVFLNKGSDTSAPLPVRNEDLTQNEQIVRGNGTPGPYQGTLKNKPVVPGSVAVSAGAQAGTDDGGGALSGTGIAGGTINYGTGELTVTFNSNVAAGTPIRVTYDGDISTTTTTTFYFRHLWATYFDGAQLSRPVEILGENMSTVVMKQEQVQVDRTDLGEIGRTESVPWKPLTDQAAALFYRSSTAGAFGAGASSAAAAAREGDAVILFKAQDVDTYVGSYSRSISGEAFSSGTGGTGPYGGQLDVRPVTPGSVTVTAGGQTLTDNGYGALSGTGGS